MSVLGAVCLHYGKEYFNESLASIRDHVDEIAVFYSPVPTHGTGTKLKCPDTREELRAIADKYRCTWREISHVGQENAHRQLYINYANQKGYNQILVADSDEVHVSEEIPKMLEAAKNTNARNVGVSGSQWLTPYRSFNEYVTDGFAPIRVINTRVVGGTANINRGFIYHMGYCISDKLMEYKISCHGHRADFENNSSWFNQKWLNYTKGETKYLHPATEAYWIETQELDKETLPQLLKDHPNYGLERIK